MSESIIENDKSEWRNKRCGHNYVIAECPMKYCDAKRYLESFELQSRRASDAGREWISVSERCPDINKKVIVFDSYSNRVLIAYMMGDKTFWIIELGRSSAVTHWMPLPQPPKE